MNIETLLLYADADPAESAIAPPIFQTVPFSAASAEEFALRNDRPLEDRTYRRFGNPTQKRLETVVASLEGAEAALATAAGMGAISTTLLALTGAGRHVVAQQSMYGGTLSLLRTLAPKLGIETTLVDQTDPAAFEQAIRRETDLFLLESPSNPLLQLTDIEAVSGIAHERGILTIVDNTIATPVNQNPLKLGADLVIHSVTKALSGHCDVLGGMVLGKQAHIEDVWHAHVLLGSVISPLDAWLALRGLRTLVMRVEWQDRLSLHVADYLEEHPAVQKVNYPGLPSHPQHDLARKQMSGFGGLLSFELRGDYSAAEDFIAALRHPARSSSLGGFRSLVVQPAALWGGSLTDDELREAGVPPSLVRIAVGLENETDLIADLDQALAATASTL